MFILKKDRNFKNLLAMLTLFAAATALDATNFYYSKNTQDARFLGIGTKHEVMPCVMGIQQTKHTFTIFGIKTGDSWYTQEAC